LNKQLQSRQHVITKPFVTKASQDYTTPKRI